MKTLVETHGKVREASGNKRSVTLIREGWGSSGYYPGEVLERDVPRAFPIGTHMYLDHPTQREAMERPERSVSELVGTLVETPRMAGAEMVAVAEVFDHYKPVIDAVAESVGLSIRALGEVEEGAAGGKDGPIVKALTEGISVDYVTHAGAGGKVGALIESARKAVPPDNPEYPAFQAELSAILKEGDTDRLEAFVKRVVEKTDHSLTSFQIAAPAGNHVKEDHVSDLDKKLSEAQDRIRQLEGEKSTLTEERDNEKTRADRAEDALQLTEATKVVAAAIGGIKGLPKRAAVRASEAALAGDLPTDSQGRIDKDALTERAKTKAKAEVEYLSEATGRKVEGFGESAEEPASGFVSETSEADQKSVDELEEVLKESFDLDEKVAKHAARGR
jgi:hypothetical protein